MMDDPGLAWTDAGRVPDHSAEAEEIVLGAMLLRESVAADMVSLLDDEDFYVIQNRAVFKAISQEVAECRSVTIPGVADRMERNGDHADHVSLVTLAGGVVSVSGASDAAAVVKDRARRRALAEIGANLTRRSYSHGSDVSEIVAEAVGALELTTATRDDHDHAAGDGIDDHIERLFTPPEIATSDIRITTPWPSINRIVSHIEGGEVAVLAARPSCGKSLAASHIITHAAKDGIPCGLISLEMNRAQIVNRILSDLSGVEAWKFRARDFNDIEKARIWQVSQDFAEMPIRIWDDPMISLDGIRGLASDWVRKHGLKLLVVDYLQLVNSKAQSREREVAEASAMLKRIAGKHNIAVLMLSQVNRDVEKRTGKRLGNADLRESGAIEQDADIIILIQPWDISSGCDKAAITMSVTKSRGSRTGESEFMNFYRKNLRIREGANDE